MMFVICGNLAQYQRGPHSYQKYLKKDGRFKFQIDLGIPLLNHALTNKWKNFEGDPPPDWTRKIDWIPCNCEKCFFCLNGLTNGIAHKKCKVATTFVQHDNTWTVLNGCTDKCVDLKKGGGYCKMCYQKLANGTAKKRALSKNEKIK
jgi:hypothetical protein